ncbi:hypothetical protein EX30DRAFT_363095 [Ascodesmis nigricans]|uniref:Uncharacterized protein n=1 Tax=Ascodesmis nigricans TaxID=341454 RepID=A0A4S2N0T6_9PEZI|nr:hypothetical protein EX30DRAFT_363095 [Ascodesmis nigricans]
MMGEEYAAKRRMGVEGVADSRVKVRRHEYVNRVRILVDEKAPVHFPSSDIPYSDSYESYHTLAIPGISLTSLPNPAPPTSTATPIPMNPPNSTHSRPTALPEPEATIPHSTPPPQPAGFAAPPRSLSNSAGTHQEDFHTGGEDYDNDDPQGEMESRYDYRPYMRPDLVLLKSYRRDIDDLFSEAWGNRSGRGEKDKVKVRVLFGVVEGGGRGLVASVFGGWGLGWG